MLDALYDEATAADEAAAWAAEFQAEPRGASPAPPSRPAKVAKTAAGTSASGKASAAAGAASAASSAMSAGADAAGNRGGADEEELRQLWAGGGAQEGGGYL